ncbi:MAG: UDP-N-acetyl-D-glucosamine 6-dehydrogenase [Chlamydiae bacterium]|nr:UDP-N-acetyl-D-glucosamine 6-dehydrogenase [Chlamydiota bacterium]
MTTTIDRAEEEKITDSSPKEMGREESLTIDRIKAKQITVGVVGLGYVGFPLSLAFSEAGVQVIGFDIDESKIQSIEQGKSYIRHIQCDRLHEVQKASKLEVTTNFQQVANCDVVIICVPTPLDHHLEPDLRFVVETCKVIAPHLKPNTLVSLESTTWPGTTDEIVKTILEKEGGFTVGKDLFLCFSPEREDPGNKSYGTKNIPKLIGGTDPKSLELATALYSLALDKVVPLSSTKVAELAKLFENIFRSVNIALVNELKVICEPMDIDVWEVIEAAATKPFGFMPFWPGPGLGGHCIPIDPFYLTWKAKEYGISTRFIELAGEINRQMPKYVVGKVQDCLNVFEKALKGSRILILGLAYKSDIDDMRESPSLELIKILEEKGATVDYHDPLLPEIGKTREYSHLAGRKHQELSKNYDCFLIATKHSCFSVEEILSFGIPVVDTRNFLPRRNELVYPA